jgi:hypothetical protein
MNADENEITELNEKKMTVEETIIKLRDMINESAERIRRIKRNLICWTAPYDFAEMSLLVEELVKRYAIVFYYGIGISLEDIFKILRSQSITEFIRNLAEYADMMLDLAEEIERAKVEEEMAWAEEIERARAEEEERMREEEREWEYRAPPGPEE